MNYTLSRATEEDAPFLKELFFDVRGPEFQQLPPQMFEQLLDMQFRAQTMSYAAQFPDAVDQIVWVDRERAGRLLIRVGPEETHLVDIALLSRYRGQGIGTDIVWQLCAEAAESGRPLRLSVRNGNRAARLYERLGFAVTGNDDMYSRMQWQEKRPAPPVAAATGELEDDGGEVEQDYTRRYFASLVGQTLEARPIGPEGVSSAPPMQLRVGAVEPLKMSTIGARVEPGDSFVLRLHGKVEELLPPMTVEIQPERGNAMAIFLSPLGPEDGRMQYEAVFNRTQPVAQS